MFIDSCSELIRYSDFIVMFFDKSLHQFTELFLIYVFFSTVWIFISGIVLVTHQ